MEISLTPIEYQSHKTWTTIQLAEVYGENPKRLKSNLNENKPPFIEYTDYFVLQGDELRKFKADYKNLIPQNKSRVSLWTISGAMKHAELLDTLSGWNGFRSLIDILIFKMNLSNRIGYSEIKDWICRFEVELEQVKGESDEAKRLSAKALESILKLEEKLDKASEKTDATATDIAKQLGLYTKAGSLHGQLIGAIAKALKMPIHTYDRYEDENIVIVPDQSNVDGYWQVFYKNRGIQRIIDWFNDNKDEIVFVEYYKRNTVSRKKGDLKGYGYMINGKRYWLKV